MNCDKCGKPVPPENDATIVQAYLANDGMHILFFGARHFLPTEDCAGSPSRAQYIEGQPRDERGFEYDPEMEAKWRKAYEQVKADAAAGKFYQPTD